MLKDWPVLRLVLYQSCVQVWKNLKLWLLDEDVTKLPARVEEKDSVRDDYKVELYQHIGKLSWEETLSIPNTSELYDEKLLSGVPKDLNDDG